MHTVSALAVALKNSQSQEFKDYQNQVSSPYTVITCFLFSLITTVFSLNSNNTL